MACPFSSRWLIAVLALVLSISSAAQEPKPDPAATRDYAVAAGLQGKQLYAQAAQRWQKFIQDYPKDPHLADAHHHLGSCLLNDKKYAEAAQTLRILVEKFPKFEALDAVQFNLGLALYHIGSGTKKPEDLRAAARAFAEVSGKFPKSKHAPASVYYQGESLYLAGDVADALPVYQKGVAAFADSTLAPDLYYALGTAQQELKQHKEAVGTFQTFLQKFPKDAQADECRLRLGESLLRDGQLAPAEKAFEQAAGQKDFPLADYALLQQAQCAYQQNEFARAGGVFEGLPAKFPKSNHTGAALVGAGKCWFLAGKLAQAQTALNAVVDRKLPESPEATYWLGQALVKLNKPAEALAVIDRTLAAYPKSDFAPQLTYARIVTLYEQPGRRKETVALFREFAREHATNELAPRGLYMSALAALQEKDAATARKHAEEFLADKALARHELLPEVLYVAAESCMSGESPDPVRAEALYRRLAADYADSRHAALARVRVGACLYRARKYADAIAYLTPAATALKDPTLQAEAQLVIGRSHYDAGQYSEAVEACRKAVQAKAEWDRADEVLLVLAQGLRAQKLPGDAADALRKLVAAYPNSAYAADVLYQMGELAREQKKYDEAVTQYAQVATRFPKSAQAPLALYGSGRALNAKGEDKQAVEVLTKVLTAYGESKIAPQAAYLRGLSQHRLGQFEAAAKDLTAFLASKPADEGARDARYTLALCQAGLKQFEQAAETLKNLLADAPNYERADRARYELAFALLECKKPSDAVEAFRQLAMKFPDSPLAADSWFRVGRYHEDAKRWAEADEAFAAGLEKAKDAALREKMQYKLGQARYQREKYEEAAKVLLELVKEHPKGTLVTEAGYLAAECLFRQDRFSDALPLFDQVAQAGGQEFRARSLYQSGRCLGGLKRWADSQKKLEELIKDFPKFEQINEARYGLGLALQNQEKLDEARAVYELVAGKDNFTESAARSRFMIGECAFKLAVQSKDLTEKKKRFSEAIEQYQEAVVYPYAEWQAKGYYEMGRCFQELKDTKNALASLEQVVKKFGDRPEAKAAARLIEELKK